MPVSLTEQYIILIHSTGLKYLYHQIYSIAHTVCYTDIPILAVCRIIVP